MTGIPANVQRRMKHTHTHIIHLSEIRRETEKRAESVEYQMYYWVYVSKFSPNNDKIHNNNNLQQKMCWDVNESIGMTRWIMFRADD